jgi:hypothetical protein
MKSLKSLAGVALLALGASLPLLSASASAYASAGTPPVLYNGSLGWHNADTRPGTIDVGLGGAPSAHGLRWSGWNSKNARATGTLWIDSCDPTCAQGSTGYHPLIVTLSGVKVHDGRAYYSVMTWYTPGYRVTGYRTSTATLHFGSEGGTIPVWH